MGGGNNGRGTVIDGGLTCREPALPATAGGGPARLGALLVLAKPGIVAAVALAGYAGMVLAARGTPAPRTTLVCLVALVLTAGGAALLNVLLEAASDARMARLGRRNAALSQVGTGTTLVAAGGALALGLALDFTLLPPLTGLLTLAAIIAYAVVYTLWLKRRSPYGAVPGGIPGALPVLIGYSAVAATIGFDGVLLFLVMLLWQPPHFWTLALHYREDYRRAGIPALPAVRGVTYTTIMIFLYATALVPASLALWAFGCCSVRFAAVALLLGLAFLGACFRYLVATSRYRHAFAASLLYLVALLTAIIVDLVGRGA